MERTDGAPVRQAIYNKVIKCGVAVVTFARMNKGLKSCNGCGPLQFHFSQDQPRQQQRKPFFILSHLATVTLAVSPQ